MKATKRERQVLSFHLPFSIEIVILSSYLSLFHFTSFFLFCAVCCRGGEAVSRQCLWIFVSESVLESVKHSFNNIQLERSGLWLYCRVVIITTALCAISLSLFLTALRCRICIGMCYR